MICIPVNAASTEAALKKMKRAYAMAGIVELRLDGMADPDLPKLLAAKAGKIVVTNRHREEGGRFDGPEDRRIARLMEAAALGADYVDMEARTEPSLRNDLIDFIAGNGHAAKVILSCHLPAGTPGEKVLADLLKGLMGEGAPVIKLVSLANRPEDNLRILNLLPRARECGQRMIAFCMGEAGRISRVMAPQLGSFLTYASLEEGEETAPGQLSVGEMRRLLRLLGGGVADEDR
ncbi:MAG: type I 3-dehydroquinate dehydratase [Syntrophaceae bacterium]|nr:type I 3-dehydroquinate dehydratase [Syntrophaceae bacterium]